MNILFICSRNQWHSPTAEAIYKDHPGLKVKSAGTEPSARVRLNSKMVEWSDVIFVMEKKHKQRMLENFPTEGENREIVILGIPDEFLFMDQELIDEITSLVDGYLGIS